MFSLPAQPQMRHWKVRLKNGVWKNVPRTIKNEAELLKAIKGIGKWEDMDIFASTTCWLSDPEDISVKNEKDIIATSDFVLDIDDTDLESARVRALMVYTMVAAKGYTPYKIVFSGSKGYHLYYDLVGQQLMTAPPYARQKVLAALYNAFIDVFGIRDYIDAETTLDPYRVIRLPGSINQKSGLQCRVITIEDLKRPAIASCIDRTGTQTAKEAHEANPPRQPNGAAEQTGRSSRPVYISNKVANTKDRYILFLKYPVKQEYGRVIKRVAALIEKFQLPDVFIFKNDTSYYAICIATYQPRQLEKILNEAKSENRSTKSHFPLDAQFIEVVQGKASKFLWLSKSHYQLYSLIAKRMDEHVYKFCGGNNVGVMLP